MMTTVATTEPTALPLAYAYWAIILCKKCSWVCVMLCIVVLLKLKIECHAQEHVMVGGGWSACVCGKG